MSDTTKLMTKVQKEQGDLRLRWYVMLAMGGIVSLAGAGWIGSTGAAVKDADARINRLEVEIMNVKSLLKEQRDDTKEILKRLPN